MTADKLQLPTMRVDMT